MSGIASHNFVENKYTILTIINGILIERYTRNVDTIDLRVAKEIVSDRHQFCKGQTFPILVDTSQGRHVDRFARLYLSSQEGLKYLSAGAIVSRNGISRLSSNLYLLLSPPIIPSKIFQNENKAVAWLKLFRHMN